MSVSPAYLEATINTAAVARHHGVEAFVNMSQMTVTQMSISEATDSPQHKLHWLSEQALSWSGLPVVTVRPTVFLEGFFLQLAAAGRMSANGQERTSCSRRPFGIKKPPTVAAIIHGFAQIRTI